jgi:chitin disaccharide deacetylase
MLHIFSKMRGDIYMKLINRIDDVGYSVIHNEGSFAAIEHGVATAADIMLETPGTEDALLRLRNYPWISIGWHTHFWGTPLLDPQLVPSLVVRKDDEVRFRKDIHIAADVNYDEALAECRAQMKRCIAILGRAPDTGGGFGNSPMQMAIAQTCRDFGMATRFAQSSMNGVASSVDPRWKNCDIRMSDQSADYLYLRKTESIKELIKFDPLINIIGNIQPEEYPDNACIVAVYHPGYVDSFVSLHGEPSDESQNFLLVRLQDVDALCSSRIQKWIIDKRIELVNFRDALLGTSEYQNHLFASDSPLFIKKN